MGKKFSNIILLSSLGISTIGMVTLTLVSCSEKKKEEPVIPTPTIEVEKVGLDKTEVELAVGETATLTPIFIPVNATNKEVSWISNNKRIASVGNNGVVHAVSEGTTTVTVTTKDGNKMLFVQFM